VRIWSLHPKYLDAQGLVALWRETLLAQAVLRGQTRGYTRHPQLHRFQAHELPLGCLADYLRAVHVEACSRGYSFATGKISRSRADTGLTVARGQLDYEWQHLMRKLRVRDPARWRKLRSLARPRPHPLFRIVGGGVAEWEKR
jgi:hypothetical protein